MAVFACGQRLMNRMFQRFCHTVEHIVCNGCLLLHKKHYIVKTFFFFINDKFLHFYTWFFNAALQKKSIEEEILYLWYQNFLKSLKYKQEKNHLYTIYLEQRLLYLVWVFLLLFCLFLNKDIKKAVVCSFCAMYQQDLSHHQDTFRKESSLQILGYILLPSWSFAS